jgi:hypothetical protein
MWRCSVTSFLGMGVGVVMQVSGVVMDADDARQASIC